MPRTTWYDASNMQTKRTNPNFMNGVPELLILGMLSEREMYGYELVRAIRTATEEVVAPGEGVVYPVLHALERSRFIASRRAEANGRSRVYYRATAKGRRRLSNLSADWRRIAEAIRNALAGNDHAPAV